MCLVPPVSALASDCKVQCVPAGARRLVLMPCCAQARPDLAKIATISVQRCGACSNFAARMSSLSVRSCLLLGKAVKV
eukprot:2172866-Pleurochrysis_carterae.AAC.4